MSKYIESEQLKEKLKAHLEWIDKSFPNGEFKIGLVASTKDFISTIDALPIADVVSKDEFEELQNVNAHLVAIIREHAWGCSE